MKATNRLKSDYYYYQKGIMVLFIHFVFKTGVGKAEQEHGYYKRKINIYSTLPAYFQALNLW